MGTNNIVTTLTPIIIIIIIKIINQPVAWVNRVAVSTQLFFLTILKSYSLHVPCLKGPHITYQEFLPLCGHVGRERTE